MLFLPCQFLRVRSLQLRCSDVPKVASSVPACCVCSCTSTILQSVHHQYEEGMVHAIISKSRYEKSTLQGYLAIYYFICPRHGTPDPCVSIDSGQRCPPQRPTKTSRIKRAIWVVRSSRLRGSSNTYRPNVPKNNNPSCHRRLIVRG